MVPYNHYKVLYYVPCTVESYGDHENAKRDHGCSTNNSFIWCKNRNHGEIFC